MAEATLNPFYDEYRFIFDNAENGALMDMERFYGKKMAGRLEPPGGNRDNPKYSGTVEEFYYHVDNAFKRGDPFIYVLDSMDALTSEDEQKTFNKGRKSAESGEESKGSNGDSRGKKNSLRMRIIFNKLRKEGKSILIIVSQTRDNIGYGAKFNPKTRGGGHALTFYASLEMWTKVVGHLKKKAN